MLSVRKTASHLDFRPGLNPRFWLVPLIMFLAVTVGVLIADSWIYCLAFCLLCLLLLWPIEVGLGAYVFFLPFEPVSVIGSQRSGTSIEWVLGVLAGIAVLGTMVVRGRFRRPPKATLWWSMLAIWATLSSAWAINPDFVFRRLPTVASLLGLYLICASTRFEERELKVVALLSIAGGCAAALYTALVYHPAITTGAAALRSSMVWGNREADPNDFALTLVLPLALSFGAYLFMRRGSGRIVMLAAFSLMSYAVLLTLSRGALIAMLVMLLIYVRYMPRHSRRRLLIPVSVFAVAAIAMSAVLYERFLLAIQTGGAGRLDIWTAGLQAIKEHGLIGAGLDNFPLAYTEVAGYASQFRGLGRAAHNIFLNVWVELGVPGLILLLAAMRSHLRNAKRVLQARADQFSAPILICHAACWSVVVGGFFLDILWRKPFWLVWTFLMLALQFRKESIEKMLGRSYVAGV